MTDTELNRRVAELVMGEPEPEMPPDPEGSGLISAGSMRTLHVSAAGNWVLDWEYFHWPGSPANRIAWQPLDFSGDFDLVMKAVDTFFENKGTKRGRVLLEYLPDEEQPWVVWWAFPLPGYGTPGQTAPEAICRLLLVLVEKDKEES